MDLSLRRTPYRVVQRMGPAGGEYPVLRGGSVARGDLHAAVLPGRWLDQRFDRVGDELGRFDRATRDESSRHR